MNTDADTVTETQEYIEHSKPGKTTADMSTEQHPEPAAASEHLHLLRNLNTSSFPTEALRLAALNEARALVQRLEQPGERMYDIAWTYPAFISCFRVARDLDLFSHLSTSPVTSAELAGMVDADPELLGRVLRVLVKEGVVGEADDGVGYVETGMSRALQDPQGVVAGLDVYCLAGVKQEMRLPQYLRNIGYRNPHDGDRPPWKWIEGVEEYQGDRWSWLKRERPEHQRKFNQFLAAVRQDSPAWTDLYDVDRLMGGWDEESVLLVDVGGGNGNDISNLARAVEEGWPNAKLVLQDREEVIANIKASSVDVPPQIELMPHNFFEKNPIEGAKVYFIHAVIHDWPDSKAHDILLRLREAMKPGYSTVLIFDRVVPERASDWDRKTAALDINMMCNYASLERSETQWKALIEGAGLQYVGCRRVPGQSSFIEAML